MQQSWKGIADPTMWWLMPAFQRSRGSKHGTILLAEHFQQEEECDEACPGKKRRRGRKTDPHSVARVGL